jgi:hypothetical protein
VAGALAGDGNQYGMVHGRADRRDFADLATAARPWTEPGPGASPIPCAARSVTGIARTAETATGIPSQLDLGSAHCHRPAALAGS